MPSALSSGGTKMPRCAELTVCSPNAISPPSGFSNPATHRSKVVLPEPLSPRSTKNSFSSTRRSTPSTARRGSGPFLNIFVSEGTRITPSLRYSRGDMLLAGGETPKIYNQRRHPRHHYHRDRRRIAQPPAMPLSPDVSREHLAFRRSQEHRHGELPVGRQRGPNPSIGQPRPN